MSKLSSKELKELISEIPVKELEKIILKIALKDKSVQDYLALNYFNKESGETELYNEAVSDLSIIFAKKYRGYSYQLQMVDMLSACIRRLNEFTEVCKNKKLEADLIILCLKVSFSDISEFGTCFSAFDYRVTLLVKRLMTIVIKKLHEDYLIEYKDIINGYLKILHAESNHNDFVYKLPDEI